MDIMNYAGSIWDILCNYHIDITNYAGDFWGMPVNFTMSQTTKPIILDSSWWSTVLAIPAAIVAILGLWKVKDELKNLAVSIDRVTNYNLGLYVTPTDDKSKDIKSMYNFVQKDKKIWIYLTDRKEPITGTVESDNPQAILIKTEMGKSLLFKHSIIEIREDQRNTKKDN